MEYFVVRIYRNEDEIQQSYGVVERVGEERRESFTNSEELWSLLNQGQQRRRFSRSAKGIKKRIVKAE